MNETELKESLRPDNKAMFDYLEVLFSQILNDDIRRFDVGYADRRVSMYRVGPNMIRTDVIFERKEPS